jgi:hypothetical protein
VAQEFLHLACLGMKLEFCELREYTYGLFVHVAEVLGEDFLEYVPTALTFAIASCKSGDGAIYYRDSEDEGIHHFSFVYVFFALLCFVFDILFCICRCYLFLLSLFVSLILLCFLS